MGALILEAAIEANLPRVLPVPWRVIEKRSNGYAYRRGDDAFTVIADVEPHDDGRLWLHVSCAHRDRLPTWEELKDVKAVFIGREKIALQVLPPEDEYVNFHPNCLHLWRRLGGGRPVPRFTKIGGLL